MSVYQLHPLDKIEIHTLLDNYTDLTVMDNSDIITRGGYLPHGGTKQPLVAEHGFSLFIRTFRNNETRSMVFDGGFTPSGAVQNARRLGLDLKEAETFVLSHGHADHWGGLKSLVKATKQSEMPLVAHPGIFRSHRYTVSKSLIYRMPQLTRRYISTSGFDLRETREPYPMLQDNVLFLGEVPRLNDFEKSEANSFYQEKGLVKQDDFADDSSIAMLLQGKGLVVIAGCAHAGIINTIHQAMKLTGENRIFAVMGGFHLTGKTKAQLAPLLKSLQQCRPRYVIPCHCTGRKASQWIEETMPEAFLLNLSGTKLTFRGCD